MEDTAALKEELAEKREALEALQRNFDDFQESSRELEEELEAELGRTQDQVSELTSRLTEVAERLGDQQAKNRAISSEVSVRQAETARLKAAATRAAAEKASLEQATDELEAKCRAAIAAEEDLRHKLDLAIEEKIFTLNDLEDLRAEALRTERALRSEIDDLRQELGRLGDGRTIGRVSTTPPQMVLPKEISSITEGLSSSIGASSTKGEGAGKSNDDAATVVDGNELVLTQGRPATAGDFLDDVDDGMDDGEGIADELIKALEEEIEGLKAELVNAELANDELNLELQELQEKDLARVQGGGESSKGKSFAGGKDAPNGDSGGVSPQTQQEHAALKQDLAEAMATCEELDQTVTDLTDDLHAKDKQRCMLETRLAELEAELGSKTQSLEEQLFEVKADASSLTAKLADAEAELRASNSRMDDVSAKGKAAQERQEVLREEAASLRERISELTSTISELSEELRDREAQLEQAQAAAEALRAELSDLQQNMKALSARLAEEVAARRLLERCAAEKEEALHEELQMSNDVAEEVMRGEQGAPRKVVTATVATATETVTAVRRGVGSPSGGTDPELAVSVGDGDGVADGVDGAELDHESSTSAAAAASLEEVVGEGGQREGQSSGEPAAGNDKAGIQEKHEAGLRGSGDAGKAAVADRPGASELELQKQVSRLQAELDEARKRQQAGGGGGRRVDVDGLDAKGLSIAEVLESDDVEALKSGLQTAAEQYGKERSTNAALLSQIRALKGNIEVICRIRPPTSEEKALGVPLALETLGDGEVGVKTAGRHGVGSGTSSWRSFTFDKALGPSTTQEQVFRQVEPLALSAADGMNTCIFAYGQTGSGKTHTMIGDAKGGEMAGISYRTMNKLFQVLELRRRQQSEYSFTVKVAMLEIYNEDIRDLLSAESPSHSTSGAGFGGDLGGEGSGVKLEIRRDQDGMVQVPGLTQVVVTSAEQVLSLLERGGGARAVAATGVHDDSSRSHSVLMAEVACRASSDALPATGRLFLVDLAGSERVKVSGVTGVGLREATNINSSLSALGDVMQALDQKQKHVPYRNSKLTFLLQDALGGNSRTAMVVTVCPTTLNVDETLFALQFATRARNVSLGPAHKNVAAKNLLEEGKDLRAKLREAGRKKEHAEEALATLQREHARSQQKMGALLESRVKNVGDVRQQLEHQINSLKSQLEASQASVLAERSKRAALQTEGEDTQRQLKRSIAKVAALGRDREDREVKLRAKQEEVGELKAEVRKLMAEAKNIERRMNVNRGVTGERTFGFKPKGAGVAAGRGSPRTPSKKLSDAKNRYTRHRENTPRRRPPSVGDGDSIPSSLAASPSSRDFAPAEYPHTVVGSDGSASVGGEAFAKEQGASAGGSTVAREGRGGSSLAETEGERLRESNGEKGVTSPAVATKFVREGAVGEGKLEVASRGNDESEAATGDKRGPGSGAGSADTVADAIGRATAIARATAGFAMPAPAKAQAGEGSEGHSEDTFTKPKPRPTSIGRGESAMYAREAGEKKTPSRPRSAGVSLSLMRGTASSTSRLRLNVPSTLEENRSGSAPRSASRRPSTVTPRSNSAPRSSGSSPNAVPPSPSHSRLCRPTSFSNKSIVKPKTPRTRNSVSGPMGSAAAAAAAATAAAAAVSSSVNRRSAFQTPAFSAQDGDGSTHGVVAGPSSSRSVPGFGIRKGWLGEKSRGGMGGGPLTASRGSHSSVASSSSAASSAGVAAQRKASVDAAVGKDQQLSRAQIALNRHQERMDRIREKREERIGGKDA